MIRATGLDELVAGIGAYRSAFPDFRHDMDALAFMAQLGERAAA